VTARRLTVPLLLLSTLLASRAAAYHSERQRGISGTAFALHRDEWEVGLFSVDYGLFEQLQLGTYTVPWLAVIPNLQLKLTLFRNDRWAVALRPGMYYADLSLPRKLYGVGPEDTTIKLWLFPIEGYVSVVLAPRFTLTASGVYTAVTGSGHYDPQDFEGTAAASNAQVGLGLEWRVNQVTALTFQARLVAFQQAGGVGSINVDLDSATTADVKAKGSPTFVDANKGYSVAVSALFSWSSFNLRVGMGYGNYNVPGMNLVVPKRLPFPIFDLFWRFDSKRIGRARQAASAWRSAPLPAH
jgi:hypothetical protein